MNKYFISCAVPNRKIGAIQLEAEDVLTAKIKAEKLCPEPSEFRIYELEEFDDFPVGKFYNAKEMKKYGY